MLHEVNDFGVVGLSEVVEACARPSSILPLSIYTAYGFDAMNMFIELSFG